MEAMLGRLQLDVLHLQPRAFACMLWGLGRLGFWPHPSWWAAIMPALVAALPDCGPRELCNVTWGLAALGAGDQLAGGQAAALGEAVLEAAAATAEGRAGGCALSPRQLSVMLSALAGLGWQPSAHQLEALGQHVTMALGAASSGSSSSDNRAELVLSLARLGAAPDSACLHSCMDACMRLLPELPAWRAVQLLCAMQRLGARPEPAGVGRAVDALLPRVAALDAADLQRLVECLAVRCVPVGEAHLQQMLAAAVAATQAGAALDVAAWETLVVLSSSDAAAAGGALPAAAPPGQPAAHAAGPHAAQGVVDIHAPAPAAADADMQAAARVGLPPRKPVVGQGVAGARLALRWLVKQRLRHGMAPISV
jgi:hypothetical protein